MLKQAIDIHDWLAVDQSTPYAERLHRDQQIGMDLQGADGAKVLAWWRQVGSSGADAAGERVSRARGHALVVLCALGLIVGWIGGGAALSYDGQAPINLLVVIGVLVLFPTGLALLTLFAAAARPLGLRGVADVLSVPAVGRLGVAWMARFGAARLGRNSFQRLGFWQLFVFSQVFTIAFFLGVLSVLALKVAFTDLAFGWSTTLNLDAASLHAAATMMTVPWSAWWPEAVPSQALVEASRFFRLDTGGVSVHEAAQLGGWWPFVLAATLFWGLLPRLLLFAFGRWRLSKSVEAYLLDHPEVTALLDRLAAPVIAYGERDNAAPTPSRSDAASTIDLPAGIDTSWVSWNGALAGDGLDAWRASEQISQWVELSAQQSDAELKAALAPLARAARVVVCVKGWEPPTHEMLDLFELVRKSIGPDATLIVLPVAVQGGVNASDRQIHAQAVARLDDPKLYVVSAS